ncbi:MAG: hypothetical protein ABSG15_02040 [FCB group bacterium]|jgi:hypothetical protein
MGKNYCSFYTVILLILITIINWGCSKSNELLDKTEQKVKDSIQEAKTTKGYNLIMNPEFNGTDSLFSIIGSNKEIENSNKEAIDSFNLLIKNHQKSYYELISISTVSENKTWNTILYIRARGEIK